MRINQKNNKITIFSNELINERRKKRKIKRGKKGSTIINKFIRDHRKSTISTFLSILNHFILLFLLKKIQRIDL